MKKRALSLFLALVLLLTVVPTVTAEEFQLTYKKKTDINGKDYIAVTGFTGTMPNELVIPEQIDGLPVAEIGHAAFKNGTFESVQLPTSLKRIRDYAFMDGKLKTITLPEGLEYIGSLAFDNNHAGGVLILPASLLSIYSCFDGNDFSSVFILSKDVRIPYYPFDGNYNFCVYVYKCVLDNNNCFSSVSSHSHNIIISFEDLPYDPVTTPILTEGHIRYVTADGKAYLVSCDASGEVTLPNTLGGCPVVELLPGAFANNQELTKLTIPDCVEKIGSWCFNYCSALRELVLPKNLKEYGESVFGHENNIPKNLTVYGYSDSPLLFYCVDMNIPYICLETGEPAPALYDTVVDGVHYRVNPVRKTATVVGCNGKELGAVLVLPETVDGFPVTRINEHGLGDLPCSGLILPDTLTYIERHAIFTHSESRLFIRMPDNEVYIDSGYVTDSGRVVYFFLPEGFALEESCRDKADSILSKKCIGYEKHKDFLREDKVIAIDGTPEDRIMLTTKGVFRLDGSEYTAIWLTDVYPMPSTIGDVPITRVAASCAIDSGRVYLGEYVRVVEDGAFVNDPTYVQHLYVPDCIEHLPADYFPMEAYPCTLYGTSGGYAEQYAKEHGLQFAALDNTPFTDVQEDAWYFPYVHDAYWAGLMNGTSKTTFEPNGTTTRAMVVQVLFNLAGESQNVPVVYIFDDVKYDDWYFLAVTWAALSGVSTGTSKTTFSPNDPVTREQLAAFLYRFTTLCGVDCKADGDLSRFADQNQISAYARDAIAWAVGAGIINGKSPTTVAPRAYATRAEIAAMLCRLLDYIDANLAGA